MKIINKLFVSSCLLSIIACNGGGSSESSSSVIPKINTHQLSCIQKIGKTTNCIDYKSDKDDLAHFADACTRSSTTQKCSELLVQEDNVISLGACKISETENIEAVMHFGSSRILDFSEATEDVQAAQDICGEAQGDFTHPQNLDEESRKSQERLVTASCIKERSFLYGDDFTRSTYFSCEEYKVSPEDVSLYESLCYGDDSFQETSCADAVSGKGLSSIGSCEDRLYTSFLYSADSEDIADKKEAMELRCYGTWSE